LTHSNDNLPGLRRPAAAGKRRSPTPALACHWFDRNGRLECRWQVETKEDGPAAALDRRQHRAARDPARPWRLSAGGPSLAIRNDPAPAAADFT
jgi:hypothetical protein